VQPKGRNGLLRCLFRRFRTSETALVVALPQNFVPQRRVPSPGMSVVRAWVSPAGELFDIADEDLYAFCTARGLTHRNWLEHISSPTSDQKDEGWRLIERLRCIGHVNSPQEHVPALSTLESFHKSCMSSSDGRNVLKHKPTLGLLLAGTYNSGKPWKKWELRVLSVAEKRQLLLLRLGRIEQPAPPVHHEHQPAQQGYVPDYGRVNLNVDVLLRPAGSCSSASGSQEVSQGSNLASARRYARQCAQMLMVATPSRAPSTRARRSILAPRRWPSIRCRAPRARVRAHVRPSRCALEGFVDLGELRADLCAELCGAYSLARTVYVRASI
jgi:hypothetical protein